MTKVHAEDHHSGAVRDLRPPDGDADRQARPIPTSTNSSTMSGRPTARPCAPSRTPAAAIFSSTKCSSRCCATRNIASRCATAATTRRSSARSTAISSTSRCRTFPSDMTITMHMCRGNYKSTFMGAGGYDAVQEILFNKINVHGYFMEYDDARSGGFEPLRMLPKGKQVVLGIVTTKTGKLESKDDLKRRIDEAAKYRAARSALPLRPVRLCVDRGRQHADRGRAMGEARPHRRGGRGRVGITCSAPSRRSAPIMSAASCAPPRSRTRVPSARRAQITAEQLKAVEDAEIKKIIAQPGRVRPEARDRRRVPPLVVALRFPLRSRRRGAEADRTGHPVRRGADQGRAARHRRQDRILRSPDDRALPVSRGEHPRHAEDDDPLADAAALPLRPRFDPEDDLSRPR